MPTAKSVALTARRQSDRPAERRPRLPYRAEAWFWFVGGDEAQVFSSAGREFVPLDDAAYQAHLAAGGRTSRIASLDELKDVLLRYGVIIDVAAQYREARAIQYLKALSKRGPDQANFAEVAGDQLGVVIEQIAALLTQQGITPTKDFADLVSTIASVKAALPKPVRD